MRDILCGTLQHLLPCSMFVRFYLQNIMFSKRQCSHIAMHVFLEHPYTPQSDALYVAIPATGAARQGFISPENPSLPGASSPCCFQPPFC